MHHHNVIIFDQGSVKSVGKQTSARTTFVQSLLVNEHDGACLRFPLSSSGGFFPEEAFSIKPHFVYRADFREPQPECKAGADAKMSITTLREKVAQRRRAHL